MPTSRQTGQSALRPATESGSASCDLSSTNDPGRRSLELRNLLLRFIDLCNAIDYAHARGILHRDIKPANIILGKHGETLMVDWGLAKATGKADPGSGERTLMPSSASGSSETLPGSALGTPAYMSPEQAEGELDRLGPRSDVYSLGATLYYLLSGKPPFAGDALDVIRQVRKGQFPAPRRVDGSIDPALEAVCLKGMGLNPEDRYATPRALADDIERWMADEPVTAWREPVARRARRWVRRNRTVVAAVAVALVAGLVGLCTVTVVQARANNLLRTANAEVKRANTELAAEKARVQDRYDLAMEAIKTFHTGVIAIGDVRHAIGQTAEAQVSYAAARTRLEAIDRAHPNDTRIQSSLATSHDMIGVLLRETGDPAASLESHAKAMSIRQKLVDANPGIASYKSALAGVMHNTASSRLQTGKR